MAVTVPTAGNVAQLAAVAPIVRGACSAKNDKIEGAWRRLVLEFRSGDAVLDFFNAVDLPRGYEGDHGHDALQHIAHDVFQNRPAMPGAQPLAVHDAHAADVALECVREKCRQCRLRLDNVQTMQVELGLHAVQAAAQIAHHGRLHACAAEDELVTSRNGQIVNGAFETFEKDGLAVCARETGAAGHRLLFGHAPVAHQWLHVTDRGSEELRVLVGNTLHATSDSIL